MRKRKKERLEFRCFAAKIDILSFSSIIGLVFFAIFGRAEKALFFHKNARMHQAVFPVFLVPEIHYAGDDGPSVPVCLGVLLFAGAPAWSMVNIPAPFLRAFLRLLRIAEITNRHAAVLLPLPGKDLFKNPQNLFH